MRLLAADVLAAGDLQMIYFVTQRLGKKSRTSFRETRLLRRRGSLGGHAARSRGGEALPGYLSRAPPRGAGADPARRRPVPPLRSVQKSALR